MSFLSRFLAGSGGASAAPSTSPDDSARGVGASVAPPQRPLTAGLGHSDLEKAATWRCA